VERSVALLHRVVFFVCRCSGLDLIARCIARRARSEFADEVAVAHAHVDDQLLGTIRGAQQIVARRQFEELTHVGSVLDERYVVR
jgi:hypothetical protein